MLHHVLTNTFVYVGFGSSSSVVCKTSNGVRKVGIWSTLLYNIYVNDLIDHVSDLDVGCRLGDYSTNILRYADDMILKSPSADGWFEGLVQNISFGLSELNLKMNSQKSSYIVFKKKRPSAVVSENIDLNGYCLERVEEIKYLGVILVSNASIANDVDRCCSAFLRHFNAICHKFKFLHNNIMIFLFISYCSSFYGIETWYSKLCSPIQ